jgi:hypothetical protein
MKGLWLAIDRPMGRETPVAYVLDGVVTVRPVKATRRKESSVHWWRLAALGVNLLLWVLIMIAVRHIASVLH